MSTAIRGVLAKGLVGILGVAAFGLASSAIPAAAQLDAPPPPQPPPGVAAPQLQCEDLVDPAERNACIGVRLQAAEADHQRALERCRELVPAGLRDDLEADQASFSALLSTRCDAQAAGVDGQEMKTFVRSRCLVKALTENTRGMLAAHPECAAPN